MRRRGCILSTPVPSFVVESMCNNAGDEARKGQEKYSPEKMQGIKCLKGCISINSLHSTRKRRRKLNEIIPHNLIIRNDTP